MWFRERSLFRAGEGWIIFNPKEPKSITSPLADSNFLWPLLQVFEKFIIVSPLNKNTLNRS